MGHDNSTNGRADARGKPLDGRTLSRLIDGEMQGGERQSVILRCEHNHAGWRQVGMAFLEDQLFRESLAEFPPQTLPIQQPEPVPVPAIKRSSSRMTIALGVVLCLGAGAIAGLLTQADRKSPSTQTSMPKVANVSDRKVVPDDDLPPPGNLPEAIGMHPPAPPPKGVPKPRTKPDEFVHFVIEEPDAGTRVPIEVPIVPDTKNPESIADRFRRAIPQDLCEELKRKGHRVCIRVRTVRLTLPDGREVLVPIESVQLVGCPTQDFD